ncbi:MAG: hypothetical protein MUF74_07875 [Cypionkella sp.]|nr:hypothetical protein [Cypionkella sp.]
MIAQVDEQNAAVVTHAMDPARKADRLADMVCVQVCAGVAAIGVHCGHPFGADWVAPDTP